MKNSILILLISLNSYAQAQTSIQNFSLTNVVDGKTVSLDQYNSFAAVVVLFTGNECPYDNYYKTRIKQLIDAYSGKVQFILVNSHLEPVEAPEKMAIHYTDLNVPYLADKDQLAMTSLGARKSPEAFLLKAVDGKFSIIYSGAIDDNPQVSTDTKQNYLKYAIDKLLAGQPLEVVNNRVIGCTIRKK
jgi:hypothetical protein